MVGGDGVGGECAVSVELLWNRLSGFISPSHLYLRRNVASGLKPISITCLHFINFRTITRELPFDVCSHSLSCTSKRSLREQGCESSLILYSVFPLIAKRSASAFFSPLQKCAVYVNLRFQIWGPLHKPLWHHHLEQELTQVPSQNYSLLPADLRSAVQRDSVATRLRSSSKFKTGLSALFELPEAAKICVRHIVCW